MNLGPFIRWPLRLKVYFPLILIALVTLGATNFLFSIPKANIPLLTKALLLCAFAGVFVLLEFIIRYRMRSQRALLHGINAVKQGHLDITVPSHTRDEMHDLIQEFNAMTSELRKNRTLQEYLKKYIDPQIAKELVDHPQLITYEGGRQTVTALFCDLKAFTELGESLRPQVLVTILNRYFTLMAEAIHEHCGIVDKFIGDGIMAYWAPPFCPLEIEEEMAVQAALAMQQKMKTLQSDVMEILGNRNNNPLLHARIGIATGPAIIGNIGSESFKSFTVIGDTINLASRLENANKLYDSKILISAETAVKIKDLFAMRELDTLLLPGKKTPQTVFEILTQNEITSHSDLELFIATYHHGLRLYRERDWITAQGLFQDCLKMNPQDKPAQKMLERCLLYTQTPPTSDWSGVSIV